MRIQDAQKTAALTNEVVNAAKDANSFYDAVSGSKKESDCSMLLLRGELIAAHLKWLISQKDCLQKEQVIAANMELKRIEKVNKALRKLKTAQTNAKKGTL